MTDDFVQLFLKWSSAGEHPEVKAWLERNGLSSMPMKQGLLVTGNRQRIEKAFAVSLENVQGPFELPIPEDLTQHVSSIALPRPRSYHR